MYLDSGFSEHLTTNQPYPFYRSQFASGRSLFQSSSKYDKYEKVPRNDFNIIFKFLLAANIVHFKDYEIA